MNVYNECLTMWTFYVLAQRVQVRHIKVSQQRKSAAELTKSLLDLRAFLKDNLGARCVTLMHDLKITFFLSLNDIFKLYVLY